MPTPNADDLLRTADHAPPLESEAAPEAITTDAPPDREVGATPSFLAGQETITFQRQRDAPSRDGSATSPSEPPHPSIPGYEIEAVLGRGGMGVVYQARHVGLNRVVALKMILAGGHAGPDDLARFRGEAEAVARLNHPNVVQVYDVGESGGLPYFSLEFVEGGSLDRKLAGTPLPPMEAAALVETLARAMAAAHAAGLVHRDLKPANVLLAADGTPKVTDFGLAKKLDLAAPGQEPAAGLTASGAILGTPSYMAPEQAGGKSNEIGPACDIYALGAILYECLAGRPPFRAATPLDTIMQVVSDEPVPPRQLNAKVPVDLETICLKCLQKEAGRRYASAAALADDLRRFLEGRPIVARPVGRLGWAAKWVRRNPVVAALVVAVGLALAIGTAGTMWFAVQAAASARDFANKAAEAQEKERYALFQKSQADEARIRADSLRLSSQSELIRPRNPGLALLLAIEATQRNPNLLAQNALYAALDECAEERTLIGHRREVAGTAFSPDSRGVVTWAHDNSARLWEIATGREIALLRHSGCVQARFSPDGRRVLTLSLARYSFGYQSFGGIPRPTASVWDAATGTEAATWKLPDNDAKSPGGAAFPDLRHVIGFSPDGTRVVLTAGGLPAPRVWEVATGRELFALEGHEAPVVAVDYSPDGRYVATGSVDHTARVWDAATGKQVAVFRGHACGVCAIKFSPDNRRVLSLGDGYRHVMRDAAGKLGRADQPLPDPKSEPPAFVWEAVTAAPIVPLKWPTPDYGFCATAQFSPDGARVLTAGVREMMHGGGGAPNRQNRANIWDAATGTVLQSFKDSEDSGSGEVVSASFGAGGRYVVTIDKHGRAARLWDAATGAKVATNFVGHADRVLAAAFSPDGRLLATGSADGTARLWDLSALQATAPQRGRWQVDGPGIGVFSPDGRRLAVTEEWKRGQPGWASHIHVWDLDTRQEVVCKGGQFLVNSLAFSPDGRCVVAGCSDRLARIWDAVTGEPGIVLRGHESGVLDVGFSSDGRHLVTTSGDGSARIWDVATGGQTLLLHKNKVSLRHASFSPDGRQVLTSTAPPLSSIVGNQGWIWDTETGQEQTAFGSKESISNLLMTWAPDGRRVLAAVPPDRDLGNGVAARSLSLCEASTGREVCRLNGHTESITCATFSLDNRRVITGSSDRTARVWNAETGALLALFPTHEEAVGAVAFSPDGRRAVTVCEEAVRLWDADLLADPVRGRPVRPLAVLMRDPKKQKFQNALFSPNSRWLLTVAHGPAGGTVELRPTDPLPAALVRKPRDLTPDERELYDVPTFGVSSHP